MTQPTRIGANGLALIKQFEGCRLNAYPDPGSSDGVPWTIGYGHTHEDIKRGVSWTLSQCDSQLAEDLCKYEKVVRDGIDDKPTTQNQFDAMVALCFNIGPGAFLGSTVLRKHRIADYVGAATAFRMWNKNAGKVMRGLINRRAAEETLYRKP